MIVFGMFVISMVFVAIRAGILFLVPAFVFMILIFVVRFLAMFIFAVIIVPIFEGDRIDTLGRDHTRVPWNPDASTRRSIQP